ncbi:hypothetical protein HNY73_005556 [Argiope bruennichi]|uniref:Secreted protein n=1 Tax=Argiope bruennichi TaxID=94029 RepID=A0A8T0FLV4_ARGBR|nr:hypothetical protein HNY73_005556 [Argiope bruennichi]
MRTYLVIFWLRKLIATIQRVSFGSTPLAYICLLPTYPCRVIEDTGMWFRVHGRVGSPLLAAPRWRQIMVEIQVYIVLYLIVMRDMLRQREGVCRLQSLEDLTFVLRAGVQLTVSGLARPVIRFYRDRCLSAVGVINCWCLFSLQLTKILRSPSVSILKIETVVFTAYT